MGQIWIVRTKHYLYRGRIEIFFLNIQIEQIVHYFPLSPPHLSSLSKMCVNMLGNLTPKNKALDHFSIMQLQQPVLLYGYFV